MFQLETRLDTITIDEESLRVSSFRRKGHDNIDWLDMNDGHPVFVIGVTDNKKRYRLVSSFEAEISSVTYREAHAEAVYSFTKGLLSGVVLTLSVNTGNNDDFVRFGAHVNNSVNKGIIDVQYPFLVFKYDTGADPCSETLILPHGYGSGRMIRHLNERINNTSHKLKPDSWTTWEMSPQNGDCDHYPGMQFAQFMAYYNNACGIFLATDDQNAGVKRFKALHRNPGMRLGISHIGDWDADRDLGYNILLRSFIGDWYDAADIYKSWSKSQSWFVPTKKRHDIPRWLIDSPAYIFVRPVGYLDAGDNSPVEAF